MTINQMALLLEETVEIRKKAEALSNIKSLNYYQNNMVPVSFEHTYDEDKCREIFGGVDGNYTIAYDRKVDKLYYVKINENNIHRVPLV